MTELTQDMLEAFAEVLHSFTEEQRRSALNQQRWKKLVVARQVGQTQIQCETVIEENASAEEIYQALAPLDGAIDRLKAKSDLSDHYFRMLNKCGEIEMSVKKHAAEMYTYTTQNRRHNQNKRIDVGLSAVQQQNLRQIEEAIHAGFEMIEDTRTAVAECRRVLDGEHPFAVLEDQLAKRLEALRGARRRDAA